MNVYATYEEVKEYLGIDPSIIDDDQLLKQFAITASRTFDRYCQRSFYPRIDTILYDHPTDNSTTLWLDEDLLSLTTFTTGNGGTTVTSSEYYLMRGNAYNRTPYNRVEMKHDVEYFNWTGTPQQANSLTGVWGYHDDYSNAWEDSQDTVQDGGGINASVTTVTVSDVDGNDLYINQPRFRPQQLIRIESEYLYITDLSESADTLTVIRGVNGSTAATHANATSIEIFRPMHDIKLALLVLAAHQYRRKDSVGSIDDRPLASPSGVVILPSNLPGEVRDIINRYRRLGPWPQ